MADKKAAAPSKEELRAPAPAGPVQATLDGAPATEGGEAEKKGLTKKKLILMIVLPLFVLGGIGGGLYFTGTLDKLMSKKTAAHGEGGKEARGGKESGKEGEGGEGNSAGAYFLEIPNMLVNLSSN